MISGMIISPAHAGDSTDGVVSNTSCIIYADPPTNNFPINPGAICDDWDPDDDDTPTHQDWVVGNYQIKFENSATIELIMEWRIHEFARASFSGIEFDIDGQGDGDTGETMGIPVDYVRNYFDIDADGDLGTPETVSDMVLGSADQNVESLATNFGTSQGASTNYAATVEDISSGGTISCSFSPNNDAVGEFQAVENAYYPPLCIRSSVTIDLDPDKLNFIGNENTNQENTLQGLLKMGTTIKMPFSIFAEAGHNSQFTIHPPGYGDITEVGAGDGECANPMDLLCNGEKLVHVNLDSSTYHKGSWNIDNSGASDGDSQLTREIWYKLVSNDPVNIDIENDKSLSIDITLNLEDESEAELQIDLYIHYISNQTMDEWGFAFMDSADFAETPWITSDGIRLVQHNEIADLSTLASQFPIGSITDAFEMIIGTDIETGPLEWRTNVENTAGIDMIHDSGTCANVGESPHNHYCLEGQYAMDSTFPVLMTSTTGENTFEFRLLDLITQQMDTEALPVNISELSNEDLETVLNSGLELGVDLGEDYIQQMIPEDLPPTEVAFNIVLPTWLDTQDETGIISLESKLDGTGNSAIQIKGNSPWEWGHAITDLDTGKEICTAIQKTCMKAGINLDFEELDIDEWSKAITLTLGGDVYIDVYRIGVAGDLMPQDEDGNGISIEAIPSDLLRQIVYFDTTEPIFSDEIDLFGQSMQFELTDAGLHQFAKDLSEGLSNEIHANSIEDENVKIDLSGIQISAELFNLHAPDAGAVSDLEPLRLKLSLAKTTVVASYSESGISVMTSKPTAFFASPILQITHAFTKSFANNMAPGVTTNGDGILINNGGNAFSTDITGPEMGLGPLGNIPQVDVSISLPPGLSLGDFSSSAGNGNALENDGRQNIFYSVPSAGEIDTLSFSIVIGWSWILKQIGVYLAGIVLAMVLLFVWRKHRVGKKSRKLENEFEVAARKALDRNAMPAAGGMMTGYAGMDEFGNPVADYKDDDLSQFMY
jgi:hypothetical protein